VCWLAILLGLDCVLFLGDLVDWIEGLEVDLKLVELLDSLRRYVFTLECILLLYQDPITLTLTLLQLAVIYILLLLLILLDFLGYPKVIIIVIVLSTR